MKKHNRSICLRSKLKNTLTEVIFIIILAVILGCSGNLFHPQKVKISFTRPPIEFVEGNIPSQTLPAIGINSSEQIEEPFFLKTEQVDSLLKKNLALLLDARNEKEFKKDHIPGARNLSHSDFLKIKNKSHALPMDKWLICYCESPSCDQAEVLAYELIYAGFQKVAVYPGGLEGWKIRSNSQTKVGDQTDAN